MQRLGFYPSAQVFFEQFSARMRDPASILRDAPATLCEASIRQALEQPSAQLPEAFQLLGALQDDWVQRLGQEGARVERHNLIEKLTEGLSERSPRLKPLHWLETVAPQYQPSELMVTELHVGLRDYYRCLEDDLPDLINLGFANDLIRSIDDYLGLGSFLVSSTIPEVQVFRLLPPHLLLGMAFFVCGEKAVGLELTTKIVSQNETWEMAQRNTRPCCINPCPQDVHNEKRLHPYVVVTHEIYHQLRLSHLTPTYRQTLWSFYGRFSSEFADELARYPYIAEAHASLLGGPKNAYTAPEPFDFALSILGGGIQSQQRAGADPREMSELLRRCLTWG